jgi:hypothetical protein
MELGLLNQPGRLCLREDSSRDCGYNKGEREKVAPHAMIKLGHCEISQSMSA